MRRATEDGEAQEEGQEELKGAYKEHNYDVCNAQCAHPRLRRFLVIFMEPHKCAKTQKQLKDTKNDFKDFEILKIFEIL